MKKIISIMFLCLLLTACDLTGYGIVNVGEDEIRITYLDVGQGDCQFIEFPDGISVLIDCGEKGNGEKITNYIEASGHNDIDYLVATHPHSDHIGSMQYVVENTEVKNFCMPKVSHTSETYINLLETVIDEKINVIELKNGENIIAGDGYRVDVLGPVGTGYESLNDYSAVIKVEFYNKSFLFTGDAETISEEEMLSTGADLNSDVLKIGHHGSTTSTSDEFLDSVSPEFAVISCGEDNSYGHPHREIVEKLNDRNIRFFRTDENGNIIIVAGESSLDIYTEK